MRGYLRLESRGPDELHILPPLSRNLLQPISKIKDWYQIMYILEVNEIPSALI